eukprot:733356-Alexandrium_andersonii.AAC.1
MTTARRDEALGLAAEARRGEVPARGAKIDGRFWDSPGVLGTKKSWDSQLTRSASWSWNSWLMRRRRGSEVQGQ